MFPLLLAVLAAPAAAAPSPATRAQWLMGTVCEITAYGPEAGSAIGGAFEEIARWDRVLSLYKEESELSAANRSAAAAPFLCSESLWEALRSAVSAARDSGGAFDPTILPVLRGGRAALGLVGWSSLALDASRRTVAFPKAGMGLDLNGIGKGIALDHAAAVLRSRGVTAALMNFGGQVYALGSPPDARGWRVLVPGLEGGLLVKDASVSTSGNEEHPGHIASPFTGERILTGPSVTVIAPTGAEADAWSTAVFVLGGRPPAGFRHCALAAGSSAHGPACPRYLAAAERSRP